MDIGADTVAVVILAGLILGAALLYASVGQAGASGYLAAMALFGLAPDVMRPVALVLNIVVSAIATLKFSRAGHFSWKLLWPFAVTSTPFAFVGGRLMLPSLIYRVIVAVLLLCAAWRLCCATTQSHTPAYDRPVSVPAALLAGLVIGLLAGLTGTGGGLLLGPLLIFAGWAGPRQAAGVSAVFILLNSTAALLGNAGNIDGLPSAILVWGPAAAVGGWIGAEYGSRRLAGVTLRRILAVVLVLAAIKMIWS